MIRHVAIIMLLAGLNGCKNPPARGDEGWRPSFADDPPKFDVDLDVHPVDPGFTENVELRWKLGDEAFSYSMNNHVRIATDGSTAGALETSTEGSIEIDPLSVNSAYLTMASQLASGQGVPFTKTYKVNTTGRLSQPDPRSQSILDLIFPLDDRVFVPGQPRTRDVKIPDDAGDAETRGSSTVGITGFATVLGRTCAVVALEHDAHIFAKRDGEMKDTGSTTHLELLGYFDIEAGRYLAIAIREHSITFREVGKSVTDRHATYLLDEKN